MSAKGASNVSRLQSRKAAESPAGESRGIWLCSVDAGRGAVQALQVICVFCVYHHGPNGEGGFSWLINIPASNLKWFSPRCVPLC